jgi:hypothetical protein
MLSLCCDLDILYKNNRFWKLNSKLGPYTENSISFYIDKETILTNKNDYDNDFIGFERNCFRIIYYFKIIKANIIYVQNENYYNMLQKNKLPDIYNYKFKINLNYCVPYELKIEKNLKKSIQISFTK